MIEHPADVSAGNRLRIAAHIAEHGGSFCAFFAGFAVQQNRAVFRQIGRKQRILREMDNNSTTTVNTAATARLSFAIYRVDASGGGKEKLASGGGSVLTFGNYEGICLGPPLPNGKRSVLLISDSGDGLSPPMLLPLVLSL